VKRRDFITLLGGAATWPLAVHAQQAIGRTGKMRVGILMPGPAAHSAVILDPFYRGLHELGYIAGQNLAIERRDGDWKPDRFPALAAELVALKVDIIVAWSTPTALAAKQATNSIPIVAGVPEYLRSLRNRVRDLGLQNVAISRGEPHDPRLPAGSVDIAILVHMYHEIAQPYALPYNLVPALRPDARVGIVDAFAPTSEHGTPPSLLRCELSAVGYRQISLDRLTGSDAYLAVFTPPSVASRTRPEVMVPCKTQ